MTEPTRYDAVDDKLVECQRGAAVRYKDWLATHQALTARVDKLRMQPDDWLLVTIGEEYDNAQAAAMAAALQRGTGRQVLVMSVNVEVSPLSPDLSEAELNILAQHFEEDGTHDVTIGAFKAIMRRVMRMRMDG